MYSIENELFVPSTTFSGSDGNSKTVPFGEIEIGENSYVAAGEIVRCNIPPESVYYKGRIYEKKYFRGIII